jgi:tRNA(fMet)-specific endonuclease VapC
VRYLIDSDILIAVRVGVPRAIDALREARHAGAGVSIISHAEVFEGAYGYPDTEAQLTSYRLFLDEFETLPLIGPIVEQFAGVRSELRRVGKLIPDMDLLIAATAMHHDAILVTRNLRHFDRIAGLRTYRPY